MRGGACWGVGVGTLVGSCLHFACRHITRSREPSAQNQRCAAPPHLPSVRASGRRTRTRSSTGWRTPGQSWWQMLPLGPPDEHGSPYKSASAFAAWPGLLADPGRAGRAAARSARSASARRFWIDDWASFAGDGRDRRPGALRPRVVRAARVRARARRAADRRHPDLRRAGSRRPPRRIPSCSSPTSSPAPRPTRYTDRRPAVGQPDLRLAGAAAARLPLVDRALPPRVASSSTSSRIDHFRGFVAYWAVPSTARDARVGDVAARARARAVRRRARARSASLPFIAEDLGVITPAGRPPARRRSGCPGMVVLQFGFDPDDPTSAAPAREPRRATASSTPGTHDTDTLRGWYESAGDAVRDVGRRDLRAYGITEDEVSWSLVRLAFASRAPLAMMQVQDVLGLGCEGRMNLPGPEGGSVDVAPGARAADERARPAATRGDRSGRPLSRLVEGPMPTPRGAGAGASPSSPRSAATPADGPGPRRPSARRAGTPARA